MTTQAKRIMKASLVCFVALLCLPALTFVVIDSSVRLSGSWNVLNGVNAIATLWALTGVAGPLAAAVGLALAILVSFSPMFSWRSRFALWALAVVAGLSGYYILSTFTRAVH